MKLDNLCKKIRKARGLTQEQLAERLNVTDRTIKNWEAQSELPLRVIGILTSFDTEDAI